MTASVRSKASTPRSRPAGRRDENNLALGPAGATRQGATGIQDVEERHDRHGLGPEGYFASMRTGGDGRFQFRSSHRNDQPARGGRLHQPSRSAGKQVTRRTRSRSSRPRSRSTRARARGVTVQGSSPEHRLRDAAGRGRAPVLVALTNVSPRGPRRRRAPSAMSDLMGSGFQARDHDARRTDADLFSPAKTWLGRGRRGQDPASRRHRGSRRRHDDDGQQRPVRRHIDPKSYTVTVRKTDYQFDKGT